VKILVSAGEASGDLYAAELVTTLKERVPEAEFFGCTGPRMRAAGVRTVVDAASLGVVGLVEVVAHVPRIYGEFRKLVRAARAERPALAILTDSPDFHMRVAAKLRSSAPVVQLVAPQAWAWRQGRVTRMRRDLARLLCIFPFEEAFFRSHGIRADYIGHPLTRRVRPSNSKHEFFRKHGIDGSRPLITMLPGSRVGEAARHLPPLAEAARLLSDRATTIVATPAGFGQRAGAGFFSERIPGSPIQVIEGETWDAIAHADVALAASGTVTVEAALLGTPMVTYYKVNSFSWAFGRHLVRVPYYSMVNLIAGRKIVPELMQAEMTGARLATEAKRLLDQPPTRDAMKRDLADVVSKLTTEEDPMQRASAIIAEFLNKDREGR
jgi:lipid-A-disaccharide synthase